MTSFRTEDMWVLMYLVIGVSLLPTLLPLVIDMRSDVCGVNDTHKMGNVCAYDWDEFCSESDEWLREWKCALVSNSCESDEMDASLINLWVNVEDKD